MTNHSSQRFFMVATTMTAVAVCGAAYLRNGRSNERGVSPQLNATAALPVVSAAGPEDASSPIAFRADSNGAGDGPRDGSAIPRVDTAVTAAAPASALWNADDMGLSRIGPGPVNGASLVAALPPSVLELVRTTTWDEQASAALDSYVTATFDTDGDGELSDLERIHAIRAMRDAVWATPESDREADQWDEPEEVAGPVTPESLSAEDRRLHHDVDERRRRDRDDFGGPGDVNEELRGAIVLRFKIEDDGQLTVAEFARYMALRYAGAAAADLNGDGRADETDLRIYLDVASPIDEE